MTNLAPWLDEKEMEIENAVAKLYEILKQAKREDIADKNVFQSIRDSMEAECGVSVSAGWVAGLNYKGAQSVKGAAWLSVEAFIFVMQMPRTAEQALTKRPSLLYRAREVRGMKFSRPGRNRRN